MAKRRKADRLDLDELRRQELEFLDVMQEALRAKVTKGDAGAIDRCLAIMKRRASLLGLDGLKPAPEEDGIDDLAAKRQARRAAAAGLPAAPDQART